MNGGEVVVCNDEAGCGGSFEVEREKYTSDLNCPYCGEPCGPSGW